MYTVAHMRWRGQVPNVETTCPKYFTIYYTNKENFWCNVILMIFDNCLFTQGYIYLVFKVIQIVLLVILSINYQSLLYF